MSRETHGEGGYRSGTTSLLIPQKRVMEATFLTRGMNGKPGHYMQKVESSSAVEWMRRLSDHCWLHQYMAICSLADSKLANKVQIIMVSLLTVPTGMAEGEIVVVSWVSAKDNLLTALWQYTHQFVQVLFCLIYFVRCYVGRVGSSWGCPDPFLSAKRLLSSPPSLIIGLFHVFYRPCGWLR